MKTIAELIKQGRIAAGISQSELARRLKITPQSVQAWESGRSTPRPLMYVDIADVLRLPLERLLGAAITGLNKNGVVASEQLRGLVEDVRKPLSQKTQPNAEIIGEFDVWGDDTPLDDDEVYVPFLKEVELSAGSGKTAVEESHKQKIRFGKLTLRRQNVQPSEAVCVTVSGNSMEPVLPDKSMVGIDRGCTNIVDGKMYAIDHDGQLRVKTLYRLPGGGVRMRSFNRDEHPDEEYSADQMAEQNIHIKGRVFWSSALW